MNSTFNLLALTGIVALSACSRNNDTPKPPQQDYDRLNGKYTAISSVSRNAVDVNMDGTATTNILEEIPALINNNLEIRIHDNATYTFTQFWPQQYIENGIEPADYDPNYNINYVNQATIRTFYIGDDNATLIINPDTEPVPDLTKFPFPALVTVEGTDLISVVITKKLYTSLGWKTTQITTTYKRWTKTA